MAASDVGPGPGGTEFDEPVEDVPGYEEPVEAASGVGDPESPVWDSPSVQRMRRDKRRRKLILLALLALLLALLAWVAWYVNANKRLPFPSTVGARESMEPPTYLYSVTGTGRLALTKPSGVAIGQNDRMYVTDPTSRSIKVFTLPGRFLFQFKALKDGKAKELKTPVHLAIDKDGNVWVTDRLLNGVYIFSPEGKFLRKFEPNRDAKAKWGPLAITVDERGYAYLSDVGSTQGHKIRIFDPAGSETASFGQTKQVASAREAIGSFYFPNGIAVRSATATSGREVFVADGDNRRVQVFSETGAVKRLIVTEGVPRGIVFTSQTPVGPVLLVTDALAHQVDIYSLGGEKLTTFGESGVFDGQFQYPNDIALDRRGRIYIVDRVNHRVQVWGWGVAEIPGVTQLPKGVPPWVCALPLLLLPLLLLLRKRKFMVTSDFVEGMVTAGAVDEMDRPRFRWIIVEHEYEPFVGRVIDGIDLGELLHSEPYSYSDASDLAARLQIAMERAGILAMGQRYKNLCTDDEELARLASALDVPVYDRVAWLAKYGRRGPGQPAGESGGDVE